MRGNTVNVCFPDTDNTVSYDFEINFPLKTFQQIRIYLSRADRTSLASITWTNTRPHTDEDHQRRSPTWLTRSCVSRSWKNPGGKKTRGMKGDKRSGGTEMQVFVFASSRRPRSFRAFSHLQLVCSGLNRTSQSPLVGFVFTLRTIQHESLQTWNTANLKGLPANWVGSSSDSIHTILEPDRYRLL